MKKFISILSVTFIVMLVLSLSSTKVYASVIETDYAYLFSDFTETNDNVTLTIDGTEQTWTVNGTGSPVFSDLDFLAVNSLGYVLDNTKSYIIYYDYISGEVTGGSTSQFRPLLMSGAPLVTDQTRTIYGASATSPTYNIDSPMQVIPAGSLALDSTAARNFGSSNTYTNLIFKLYVYEVDNTNDFDLFTSDETITNTNYTINIINGHQVVINGIGSTTNITQALSSYINSAAINSGSKYIVSYQPVSGSLTGTAGTGWAYDFLDFPTTTIKASDYTYYYTTAATINAKIVPGSELVSLSFVLHGSSAQTLTYDNLTFNLYVQELVAYQSHEMIDHLHMQVNGSDIVASDYFDLIDVTGGYQLQALTEANNVLDGGDNFVYLQSELSSGDYTVHLGFNDGVFDQYYRLTVKRRYSGSGGTSINLIGSVTSLNAQLDFAHDSVSDTHTVIFYDDETVSLTSDPQSYVMGGNAFSIFIEEIPTSTVNYYVDNVLQDTSYIITGDLIETPYDPADQVGFVFLGWEDVNGTAIDLESETIDDATLNLYAVFVSESTPTYTVTYETDGGTALDPATVYEGYYVTPGITTKTGYTFVGWYLDDALTLLFNPATTTITENITLYAKWVADGGAVITPDAPTQINGLVIGGISLVALAVVGWLLDKKRKGSH